MAAPEAPQRCPFYRKIEPRVMPASPGMKPSEPPVYMANPVCTQTGMSGRNIRNGCPRTAETDVNCNEK